jgi:metal-responsive CopG/Arc/MetJ family transcriptional regulator
MKNLSEIVILTNHAMKQKFENKNSHVFSIRLNSDLLKIVNTLTEEANVSKNQLINVALYEFLKQQNVLKGELEKT